MNLSRDWDYLVKVATLRLASNKTPRHVSLFGSEIELIGAAGELAARRFLGIDEALGTTFDGGVDLEYAGRTIDVKATKMTPKLRYRYLQWPEWKPVKSDIILLTAVDVLEKNATVVGFALREEIKDGAVNYERDIPCYEIPILKLRSPWELLALEQDQRRSPVQNLKEWLMAT